MLVYAQTWSVPRCSIGWFSPFVLISPTDKSSICVGFRHPVITQHDLFAQGPAYERVQISPILVLYTLLLSSIKSMLLSNATPT